MTFTELLPATKTEPAAALKWDADARTLTVQGKRTGAVYTVGELETDGGRGFQLVKVKGGSDKEEMGYACFVSARGPGFSTCDCKGWLRWGGLCKHLSSLVELLKANQL